jgi:hypothetical protein
METENIKEIEEKFDSNDQYWVNKNKGLQLLEHKYPTYGEHSIDSQMKTEITYENLIADLNAVLDVLTQYQNLYKLLISENKGNIIKVFLDHNLKYLSYRIHAQVLYRQIVLLLLKLKHLYEGNTSVLKIIEKDYVLSEDGYINAILDSELINQLVQRDELNESIAYLKMIRKHEENLRLHEHRPSISGISIALKYLKNVIESICIIILSLEIDDCHRNLDDLLLDLFFNVRIKFT